VLPGYEARSRFFTAKLSFFLFREILAELIDKDVSITKLNSSNYQEGKRDIRMVLIMKDL